MKRAPFRNMVMPEKWYRTLDPGIRFPVRVLHAHGFETCQSCQGGKGHAYHDPTIDMLAGASGDTEGIAALGPLAAYGLDVRTISITWSIDSGLPYEKLWRIAFVKPVPERANDKLTFIWSYQAQ